MTACPRGCGGSLVTYGGQVQCLLCGRGETLARPPTAEESAGEVVRNTDKLFRFKMKRRREAAARKASRTA